VNQPWLPRWSHFQPDCCLWQLVAASRESYDPLFCPPGEVPGCGAEGRLQKRGSWSTKCPGRALAAVWGAYALRSCSRWPLGIAIGRQPLGLASCAGAHCAGPDPHTCRTRPFHPAFFDHHISGLGDCPKVLLIFIGNPLLQTP